MADRFLYSGVRQKIIDMMKMDLMGPSDEKEVLDENPKNAYITGILAPRSDATAISEPSSEQEVDSDIAYEDGANYTAGEDDDNEPITLSRFKMPSSIGISFYIQSDTPSINIEVSWGDYTKNTETKESEDEKSKSVTTYPRIPMGETVQVNFAEFTKSKEYALVCDSNVNLHVTRISLKKGYSLVTAYVINARRNPESNIESLMFQVKIKAYSVDDTPVFLAEHICREVQKSNKWNMMLLRITLIPHTNPTKNISKQKMKPCRPI